MSLMVHPLPGDRFSPQSCGQFPCFRRTAQSIRSSASGSSHSSTPSWSRRTRSILAAIRSLWVATRAALPSPRTRLRNSAKTMSAVLSSRLPRLVEAEAVAAHPRAMGIVKLRHFLARDPDRPLEPALEQPDRLKQSRFARARWAEQSDDLALPDGQIDSAKHVDPDARLFEASLEAADLENAVIHSEAPAPDRSWRRATPGSGWREN